MPDSKRPRESPPPQDDESPERGIGESGDDEPFEDTDDLDDEADDDEDEEMESMRGIGENSSMTSEIGTDGGSQGDLETERRKPRVMGQRGRHDGP